MSVPTAGSTREYEPRVVYDQTSGPRDVARAGARSWSRGSVTAVHAPRPQSVDRSGETP